MIELQKYLFENGYSYQKMVVGDKEFLIVSEQVVDYYIKTNWQPWETPNTGTHILKPLEDCPK